MSRTLKVLLVADPRSRAALDYLAEGEANDQVLRFELLWWERRDESRPPPPAWIAAEHVWTDYASPAELLARVRPDRVVLFEIIDLRQIALIVTARAQKVPTYYLEHGAAGDAATALRRMGEIGVAQRIQHSLRSLRRLPAVLGVRRFYFSALPFLGSARSRLAFLALPQALAMLPPGRALRLLQFPERVPDYALVFSRANQEEFETSHGPPGPYQAVLTGVPAIDRYYQAETRIDPGTIVYIEHPYLEEGINDWTAAHHERVARALERFARERGVRVLVKLHPRSRLDLWQRYGLHPAVEVVQTGDYHDRFLRAELILSYASSLLTGLLCARKNVVFLRWHPGPVAFGAPFDEYGLCHTSNAPEDLFELYDRWLASNLCLVNEAQYQAFLDRFNRPFDGRAAERVRRAILEPPGA